MKIMVVFHDKMGGIPSRNLFIFTIVSKCQCENRRSISAQLTLVEFREEQIGNVRNKYDEINQHCIPQEL